MVEPSLLGKSAHFDILPSVRDSVTVLAQRAECCVKVEGQGFAVLGKKGERCSPSVEVNQAWSSN